MQPASSPPFIQNSRAEVHVLQVREVNLEAEILRSIGWKDGWNWAETFMQAQ
jgi:hypothetical protein